VLEAEGRVDEARMVYRSALERGQFKPEVIRFLRRKALQISTFVWFVVIQQHILHAKEESY